MAGALPTGELLSDPVIEALEPAISFRVERFAEVVGRAPGLLIVAPDSGHDGSERYMKGKLAVGSRLGIDVDVVPAETLHDLYGVIEAANGDPSIDGIIVQVPLKADVERHRKSVLNSVDPAKDVDALGQKAQGIPATTLAIDMLLESYGVDVSEEAIVLNGLGDLATGPLYKWWTEFGATNVIGIDINTDPLDRLVAIDKARVVVSATGKSDLLTPDLFLPGTESKVIVDVGTAGTAKPGEVSQQGDVSEELRAFIEANNWGVTPRTRGVGAITIRTLYMNLMDAAEQRYDLEKPTNLELSLRTTSSHPLRGIVGTTLDRESNPHFLPQAPAARESVNSSL